jgi:hypothetical protein
MPAGGEIAIRLMIQRSSRPLSRHRLLVCVLINQVATPGLGSFLARRYVAGVGQLLLALTGFTLIMTWMGRTFYNIALERMDRPSPPNPPEWLWTRGWIFFGAAWLWALLTSIGLLRQMRAERKRVEAVPPVIEPPGNA